MDGLLHHITYSVWSSVRLYRLLMGTERECAYRSGLESAMVRPW